MPKVLPANKERNPIPVGSHTLTLSEVKEIESENTFDEPIGTKPDGSPQYPIKQQFIWVFHSSKSDEAGEPYEYVIFTGRRYGDERAKLTGLLNTMLPDANADTLANLDTDSLIGRRYKATIRLVKNQKGNEVPRHVSLVPIEEIPT